MSLLKKTAIAAASAAILSTSAYAGSMEEPVMEPEIVVEESTGTGSGWVVPVIILALVAALAAS